MWPGGTGCYGRCAIRIQDGEWGGAHAVATPWSAPASLAWTRPCPAAPAAGHGPSSPARPSRSPDLPASRLELPAGSSGTCSPFCAITASGRLHQCTSPVHTSAYDDGAPGRCLPPLLPYGTDESDMLRQRTTAPVSGLVCGHATMTTRATYRVPPRIARIPVRPVKSWR